YFPRTREAGTLAALSRFGKPYEADLARLKPYARTDGLLGPYELAVKAKTDFLNGDLDLWGRTGFGNYAMFGLNSHARGMLFGRNKPLTEMKMMADGEQRVILGLDLRGKGSIAELAGLAANNTPASQLAMRAEDAVGETAKVMGLEHLTPTQRLFA